MAFLQQIFPLHSNYLNEKDTDNTSASPQCTIKAGLKKLADLDCDKIIIMGPDTADKTSLVFQAAVNAATMGVKVTYISTHPLKRLPIAVHGMPAPEPDTMKNVELLYLEECSGLIAWFASVHTKSCLPGLIVIEDVLTYASQLNDTQLERSLARLCATISDGLSWIAAKNETIGCQVIMTAPSRILSLRPVLQQFAFKLAEYHGSSGGSDSGLDFGDSDRSIHLKFRRHKDCLMMTEVTVSKHNQQSSL